MASVIPNPERKRQNCALKFVFSTCDVFKKRTIPPSLNFDAPMSVDTFSLPLIMLNKFETFSSYLSYLLMPRPSARTKLFLSQTKYALSQTKFCPKLKKYMFACEMD